MGYDTRAEREAFKDGLRVGRREGEQSAQARIDELVRAGSYKDGRLVGMAVGRLEGGKAAEARIQELLEANGRLHDRLVERGNDVRRLTSLLSAADPQKPSNEWVIPEPADMVFYTAPGTGKAGPLNKALETQMGKLFGCSGHIAWGDATRQEPNLNCRCQIVRRDVPYLGQPNSPNPARIPERCNHEWALYASDMKDRCYRCGATRQPRWA